MAKLPDQFEFKTLRSMKDGEQVFVSPWALIVDLEGECYLDLDIKTNINPESNYKLKVQRQDGQYIVHCSEMVAEYDFKWKRAVHSDQVDLTKFCSVSQIV